MVPQLGGPQSWHKGSPTCSAPGAQWIGLTCARMEGDHRSTTHHASAALWNEGGQAGTTGFVADGATLATGGGGGGRGNTLMLPKYEQGASLEIFCHGHW